MEWSYSEVTLQPFILVCLTLIWLFFLPYFTLIFFYSKNTSKFLNTWILRDMTMCNKLMHSLNYDIKIIGGKVGHCYIIITPQRFCIYSLRLTNRKRGYKTFGPVQFIVHCYLCPFMYTNLLNNHKVIIQDEG